MNTQLESLITQCVLKGTSFEGKLGSTAYTVQDLVHSVSLDTLNGMYKRLKKELADTDTDSLFQTKQTAKRNSIEFKISVVEEIFSYRLSKEAEERKAIKARQVREEKLALLKNIKGQKELEALKELSLEDLEKEIASLE